jgi:hypothetical protein
VNAQRASEIQAVLEGVPLPATRKQLLEYARENDASVVSDLQGLPDAKFDRLDAVGELLTMPESGKPPGGADYLTAHPADTGKVHHDAPRTNPPQQAIEKASKTQKRQQAEQGS